MRTVSTANPLKLTGNSPRTSQKRFLKTDRDRLTPRRKGVDNPDRGPFPFEPNSTSKNGTHLVVLTSGGVHSYIKHVKVVSEIPEF